jgi:hypothetical protein
MAYQGDFGVTTEKIAYEQQLLKRVVLGTSESAVQ